MRVAAGHRAAPAAPQQANGAIYQAVAYRPLFEDHRARLPGDTLTVVTSSRRSARAQKSTSSVDVTEQRLASAA